MKIVAAAAVLLISGCFNPTQDNVLGPLDSGIDGGGAVQRKPNLMFLVDKSGSMNFAANDQLAPCTPGCNASGNPGCAAGCRTRLQELKSGLGSFLTANPPQAWMGMAIFPTGVAGAAGAVDACGATGSADIQVQLAPDDSDDASMIASAASSVNAKIQALVVGGGTPTGDSLKFLGAYPPLSDPGTQREAFIVLITDGVPNCNANNANTCNAPAACKCTLAPATSCTPASFCTLGCLDSDNSVAQITALRQKNIKTIVIGFGADTASGDGPDTLNAMAEAGGFARACPNQTDAECGTGNICNGVTRLCNRKYFQATSAAELAAALNAITMALAFRG